MNERGCKRLCAAVLTDAIKCYRSALASHSSVDNYEAFFRGSLCHLYLGILEVSLTGDDIINEIRRQAK